YRATSRTLIPTRFPVSLSLPPQQFPAARQLGLLICQLNGILQSTLPAQLGDGRLNRLGIGTPLLPVPSNDLLLANHLYDILVPDPSLSPLPLLPSLPVARYSA
ncbi:MAG: hypothetical protein NTU53_03115, partial [Planctomycetota bacterium]|nr:hypothetical protein [Planctomycetota bacterium]